MSTSSTLPAGFSITSINGQRCTAVPRSLTTLSGSVAAGAAQPPTVSTTSTTTPSSTLNAINTAGGTPIVSSTAVAISKSVTVPATTSTPKSGGVTAATASPALKGTTLTVSSSTKIPIAQSEISALAIHVSTITNANGFLTSKTTATSSLISTTATAESSAAAGISSNISPASVVGGILGSITFIALVALIFWFFRRRRRNKRESLLTPLTTGIRSSFSASDKPPAPTGGSRWKAGLGYQTDRLKSAGAELKESLWSLGASLKSKFARDRSGKPSVDLNRGNSQFLDGPIPQHSRNNSILSGHVGQVFLKDKATDWWKRLGEKFNFNWRLRRKVEESADPFASARSMTEKRAHMNKPPDFSQLLGMDEGNLQLKAEPGRASLARGTSTLGSLGVTFGNITNPDPFVDPVTPKKTTTPFADPLNPFLDPQSRPEPSIPKTKVYIADIRRSRGQSIDAATTSNNASASIYQIRPHSTLARSRDPSTIAPSRDSYRDTIFSSFSSNTRRGKGRSDPFDLERPELWKPRVQSQDMYPPPRNPATMGQGQGQGQRSILNPNTSAKAHGILGMDFNGQPGKRVDSNLTYGSSKYSSGISGLSEWGDPGPDVEPGSLDGGYSLKARGSGDGYGSGEYAYNGQDIYAQQLRSQGNGNVSPMSRASSEAVVGKAM